MAAEREVKYVDSGGLQIAYEVMGDGPIDIIVLFEWGCSLDLLWDDPRAERFLRRIAEFGRLIRFDIRGTGLSDRVDELPPLEDWVDDISAVMAAVGSERVALVGHGHAAQPCLLFAATHPQQTAAVVSINGFARLRRGPAYPWGFPPQAEASAVRFMRENWGTGRVLAGTVRETPDPRGQAWLARLERASATSRAAALTHGLEMVRSFRTRNKFSATSVDQLPHQLLSYLMYGHQLLLPIPDIDRTSYFLVFGGNPMASNGSLMTVPDFPSRLRELKARGGRMVVFDPRRTETAKVASEHVFVRPGADAWVLLAMLNTLFDEGLTSPPDYVDGLDTVRRAIAPYTPERADAASGVAADTIRRIAREFAAADGAAAYGRIGISTAEFGTVCQWAVQLLNLVTGNLDRAGGTMLTTPAIDVIRMGLTGPGHVGRFASRVRGAAEFGGELPVSVLREEIETPGEGQIHAMLTVAGNPVLSTPDGSAVDRAFESLDFMAAVDIYVNETTRHANVILPPTTALERDHYDLVFHLLAVRNTARFTPAVFPKGGDQRHDWEIFREIARRTTRRLTTKPSTRRRVDSFARLAMSPTTLLGLLLLSGRRTSLRALRRNPAGVDLGPLEPGQFPRRLLNRNRRVDAAPELVVDDLARLDAQVLPSAEDLVLIGRRHQRDCNSWMHNSDRLTKGQARHQLLVNPADLAARGLNDGAVVRVTSRVGTVDVEARATDDMMPGVVSLPHGYGHQGEGVRMAGASKVAGASINDLTDPDRLDVSGNAALSGVPVRIA